MGKEKRSHILNASVSSSVWCTLSVSSSASMSVSESITATGDLHACVRAFVSHV